MPRPLCQRALCLATLLLSACGGSSSGGSSGELVLLEASHGFGPLLPYRAAALDAAGQPTEEIVALRTWNDFLKHVTPANPVIAPVPWPAAAELPSGGAGNHYVAAHFSQPLDPASVFDKSGGGGSTGLGSGVIALALSPEGVSTALKGRAFVGGMTLGEAVGADGLFVLERWVQPASGGLHAVADADGDGAPDPGGPPGLGFPGTEGALDGAAALASPNALVFVADSDGDLLTHETFPAGVAIQLRFTQSLRSVGGKPLAETSVASASVGPDVLAPEVLESGGIPAIVPGNGDVDVDPSTSVSVRFTEPIQPWSLGDLPAVATPALAPSILLQFGPEIAPASVPFHVEPASPLDLTTFVLTPAYAFPGGGPAAADCGLFDRVDVRVLAEGFRDLGGNANANAPATFFFTGQGAGLVNAPIAPEALYLGRGGASPSLSVVDLNGFGFGTGNPAWDPSCAFLEEHSNARNDPNVLLQADKLIPNVTPGACGFNGGSAGLFTLTRDSNLDDRLVRGDALLSISDMALGHALDATFNAGAPFGCQSGAALLCASSSFKLATFSVGTQSVTLSGFENLIEFAPHPNPPPLVFPPPCLSPLIGAQEPTSVDTLLVNGASNLLQPGGQPFGNPAACAPPDGLYSPKAHVMTTWGGPSQVTTDGNCPIFTVRQQIGHFLYVADRVASEVVVLNSNRMSVIERIPVPDPTSFAMSPNLTLLAVSSEGANSVAFIDIEPGSAQFHKLIKTVPVGKGPTGIAWDPGNEDILVCNTAENTVSVISVAGLVVRKLLKNQLSGPLDVAITPRQLNFGMARNVYFAYILNADGRVSIFESGPNGVNGWGYDEIIGVLPFTFREPRAIQPDPINMNSGFWVAHQDQLGSDGSSTGLQGGAITNVAVISGTTGMIPLDNPFAPPGIRDLQWGVLTSIGSDQLTGAPSDIAFDDWNNSSVFPNYTTPFSSGPAKAYNGKGMLRLAPNGAITLANQPTTLYAAVPVSSEGLGAVDVIDLGAGHLRLDANPFQPGVQSIPASGVNVLMHYFRQ